MPDGTRPVAPQPRATLTGNAAPTVAGRAPTAEELRQFFPEVAAAPPTDPAGRAPTVEELAKFFPEVQQPAVEAGPSFGERLGEAFIEAGQAPRAAIEMVGQGLQGYDETTKALARRTGLDQVLGVDTSKPTFIGRAGEAIESAADVVPERHGAVADVYRGLGQLGGGIATALIPGAGPVLSGVLFAGQQAHQAKLDAAQIGGPESRDAPPAQEDVDDAVLLNNLVGLTDILPVERFARLLTRVPKGMREEVASRLRQTFDGAVLEGGQEFAQNMLSDIVAGLTYDPGRSIDLAAAAYGGGIGGAVGGIAGFILPGRSGVPESQLGGRTLLEVGEERARSAGSGAPPAGPAREAPPPPAAATATPAPTTEAPEPTEKAAPASGPAPTAAATAAGTSAAPPAGGVTFTTAKGSTYAVHDDGTTTRNKAYRPEHGPDEQGPQPRSEATFYVDGDQLKALGEFAARGGDGRRAVAPLGDGRWGVTYTTGKQAGKFERRTVITPHTAPAVGLMPVEVWDNGLKVHFGNPIIALGGAPAPAAAPAPLEQQTEAGHAPAGSQVRVTTADGIDMVGTVEGYATDAQGRTRARLRFPDMPRPVDWRTDLITIEPVPIATPVAEPATAAAAPAQQATAQEEQAQQEQQPAGPPRSLTAGIGNAATQATILRRAATRLGKMPAFRGRVRVSTPADGTAEISVKGWTLDEVAQVQAEIDRQRTIWQGRSDRARETGGPVIRRPLNLVEFLASRGGLAADAELDAFDARRVFVGGFGPLVRRNGMTLDMAREAAAEAGYPRSDTITDFLDAIRDATFRRDTYSGQDVEDVLRRREDARADEQRAREEDWRAELAPLIARAEELDIEVDPTWDAAELGYVIAEREGMIAQLEAEDAAIDAELENEIPFDIFGPEERADGRGEAEAAARDEAPEGDRRRVGAPEPQAPAEDGAAPRPRPAAAEQRPVARPAEQPAGQDAERDAGADERAVEGAPAAEVAAEPRSEPAPANVAGGGAQLVIPGAERSAQQAAESREAEGRGKIRAAVPQKPADEGLFGEPDKQPDLLDQAGSPDRPVPARSDEDVQRAAARAEEPKSAEQADAGNFPHGHIRLWPGTSHALEVAIETPRGGIRRDLKEGKWIVEDYPATYGRIKGTTAADGEGLDIFVGPNPDSDRVFVIDQQDPHSAAFDEHKVMVGYRTVAEATRDYKAAFTDRTGAARIQAVTPMSAEELKAWLDTGETTKALGGKKPVWIKKPLAKGDTFEHKGRVYQLQRADETGVGARDLSMNPPITRTWPSIEAFEKETGQTVAEKPAEKPEQPRAEEQPAAPAGERQKDSNGNPVYDKGERVEITDGPLKGRHGVISQRDAIVMQALFGASKPETSYHYRVKTDQGYETFASSREFQPETSPAPENVVSDPIVNGAPETPEGLLRSIGYAVREASNSRASAQRRRMPRTRQGDLDAAAAADERAAKLQAAFDAWAAQHPEAAARLGVNATDVELRQKIEALKAKRFKTASDERLIEIYQRQLDAKAEKWSVGDGVGYRVDRQINRGFRIIEIDAPTKTVTLRQVADTGLTTTGGADRISDVIVGIGDLVRDRKYDAPVRAAAPAAVVLVADAQLRIDDYGDGGKLIIIRGRTKENLDRIKALGGGRWHRGAGGWTFYKSREAEIREKLQDLLAAPVPAGENEAAPAGDAISESDIDDLISEAFGKPAAAEQPSPPPPPAAPAKTAAQAAKDAASETIKGIDDITAGLTRLFGGTPGRLGSGPSFDEDTYRQAKPYFDAAEQHFAAAGQNARDMARQLIAHLKDVVGWTEEMLRRMNPYLARYVNDRAAEARAAEAQAEAEAEPDDESTDRQTESTRLARRISQAIAQEKAIDWRDLFRMADEEFGGTQAEGRYTPKDAYDAMELGVNLWIRNNVGPAGAATSSADLKSNIRKIEDALNLLPAQTKRTIEQVQFQQFSTPPHYAAAVAWLGSISPRDTVVEPSAGVGGIAVHALGASNNVVVNELSKRRAALLEALPFHRRMTENAEYLNSTMPRDVRPTVVIMNPPFSQTAGRMGDKRDLDVGARHIMQMLKRLEPGGRLVAIVGGGQGGGRQGEGMSPGAPRYRSFFDDVAKIATLRANVGVDGKVYGKYGTNFGTRVLVIDKVPGLGAPVTGDVENVPALVDMLEGVRHDRQSLAESVQPGRSGEAAPGRSGSDGAPGARSDAVGNGQSAGQRDGAGAQRPGGPDRGPGELPRPGESPAVAVSGAEQPAAGGSRRPAAGRGRAAAAGAPEQQDGGDAADLATAAGERERVELERPDGPVGPQGEITEAVYETYRPAKVRVTGSKPHPTKLVESAAMASVEPPAATYTPAISKRMIADGVLSEAQLEPIVYAGQAHQDFLPGEVIDGVERPGARRGFFIGDGTGVGKGREVGGIILDNWNQGRKRHVWISKSTKLINDARRDWTALGHPAEEVLDLRKTKLGTPITAKQGILFLTYDTLRSGNERRGTRLKQVLDWLGPEFDGVIAFDEAHKMGNALAIRGARGITQPSQTAITGVELQRALPKARVVYASATGATDITNLSYAERLGLWGRGTPFATKEAFINEVSQGGVAAMELIARDLKQLGLYGARSVSFDGVTQEPLEHRLTPKQREMYDHFADAWQGVLRSVDQAMEEADSAQNAQARSAALSAFWSAHQRFFNAVLTSLQMPTVLETMKKDLDHGEAIVVQLVNTNEAQQERSVGDMAEDDDMTSLDLSPRQVLLQYIETSFPVNQYEEYEDDDGNTRTRVVRDDAGNPVKNAEVVAMRDALIQELASLQVPAPPLEQIIETFGTDMVAEVTGRGRRFVREADGRLVEEKRGDRAAQADIAAFLADKKRILVFSMAGGTGASYHAGKEFANQRKRNHYLVQAGWRADEAVQGFGRSHRSNQVRTPHYRLVQTDLKGHKRFISTIARRLDQLGALTKGQRQAGAQGMFKPEDNLESQYADDALTRFWMDLYREQIEGLNFFDVANQMGLRLIDHRTGQLLTSKLPDVPRFLNRLLSLRIDLQNEVFDAFFTRLQQNIEAAATEGNLDLGVEVLRADSIAKTGERTVYTDQRTGAETKLLTFERKLRNRFFSFDQVRDQMTGSIYVYRNLRSDQVWAPVRVYDATNTSGTVVQKTRLLGIARAQAVPSYELRDTRKWERIDDEAQARRLWDEAIANAPEFDTDQVSLITGAVLPIWDRLKGQPQVYRLQTDAGERYLGRVVPEAELATVLRNLGQDADAPRLTPEQAVNRVLDDGWLLRLANGWTLKRSSVSGEHRIEIEGPDWNELRTLREREGVIVETISYKTRAFLPVGERAVPTMTAFLQYRPIVAASGPRGARPDFAMAEAGPRRFGIPADASEVVASFTNDTELKAHPDYRAAKGGDPAAATRMVPALVKPENVAEVRRRFGSDVTYVPVIAEEASGRNKIPEALAGYYAAVTGAAVTDQVVQATRAFHTGARPLERLIARPLFAGVVEPGRRYVLVDDVSVLGGTLAELANHIRNQGGQVVGVVTLVNAGRSSHLVPDKRTVRLIEGRYGDVIREIGIEPAALTADEAKYLIGFRDAVELRNSVAAARSARDERLRRKGVRPSEAEGSGGVTPPGKLDFKAATETEPHIPGLTFPRGSPRNLTRAERIDRIKLRQSNIIFRDVRHARMLAGWAVQRQGQNSDDAGSWARHAEELERKAFELRPKNAEALIKKMRRLGIQDHEWYADYKVTAPDARIEPALARLLGELERLGIPSSNVTFVSEIDADSDLAAAMRDSGGELGGRIAGVTMDQVAAISLRWAGAGTGYHEGIHIIENALGPYHPMVRLLERETERLRPWAARRVGDAKAKLLSPKEVRAYAGEAYLLAREAGQPVAGIHARIRAWWDEVAAMFRRIGNMLRGLGFQAAEDIYQAMGRGEYGAVVAPQQARVEDFAREGILLTRPDLAVARDVTALPEFAAWFGDSKVVDEGGRPRIMYHGTKGDIGPSFDPARRGQHTKAEGAKRAFFFTSKPGVAEQYAEKAPRREFVDEMARLNAARDALVAERDRVQYETPYEQTGTQEWVDQLDELNGRIADHDLALQTLKNYAGAGVSGFYSTEVILRHHRDVGAARAAALAKSGGEALYPVYLSLQNPVVIEGEGRVWHELPKPMSQTIAEAEAAGHDGVIFRSIYDPLQSYMGDEGVSDVVAVLRPEQIKSAFNRGTFDRNDARISFSVVHDLTDIHRAALDRVRTAPTMAKVREAWEWARWQIADRFLPLLRAERYAEEVLGRALTAEERPYAKEELYSGRATEKLDQLQDQHVMPLLEALHASGLHRQGSVVVEASAGLSRFEEYLYARHAEERNAQIARINPHFEEGEGSGMTDAEAREVLRRADADGLRDQLEALAGRVDQINEAALQERVAGGLMSEHVADIWRSKYEHYVPLKGVAEVEGDENDATRPRAGRGYDVRGRESRRAAGRRSRASSILANVLMQAEEAIIRSEKNRVAQSLLRLAEAVPEPDLWEVDKVKMEASFSRATGLVSYRAAKRLSAAEEERTVVAKVDGVEYRITINDDRLARAMKNLDADKMGSIVKFFAAANRLFAGLATSWNPQFVFTNIVRDLQTAAVHLKGTGQKGLVKDVLRDYPKALAAIWHGERGHAETNEWRRYAREYAEAGGKVGFFRIDDLKAKRTRLERELRMMDGGSVPAAMRAGRAVKTFVEDANAAVENAVRLSTFVNARRRGLSTDEAASLAKNLTVNFNRRGQAGPTLNALYMFFNAGVQGSATMFSWAARSATVRRIMLGIFLSGFLLDFLNALLSGDDEDGVPFYDKNYGEAEKARNWIIMLSPDADDAITVPMPWGYNALASAGRNVAEFLRGKKSAGQAIGHIVAATAEAFSPLQGSDLLEYFVPSWAKPGYQVATNQNWRGEPIAPRKRSETEPESQRYYRNVSSTSKWIAEKLNELGGGNEFRSAPDLPELDVSPEYLDYLFASYTSGLGRFIGRTLDLGTKVLEGEDVELRDVPIVGVYRKGKPAAADRSAFYEAFELAEAVHTEFRDLAKAGRTEEAERVRQSNGPILALYKRADATRGELARVRHALEAVRMSDLAPDLKRQRIDGLEEQEQGLLTRFNAAWHDQVERPLQAARQSGVARAVLGPP
jgi:hypothetical protein